MVRDLNLWGGVKPLVFVFTPDCDDVESVQERARLSVLRWVEQRGWECLTRRAVRVRIQGGGSTGRLMQIVEPWDAEELYRAIHRRPTAVVQVGGISIRLDPSAPPSPRNVIPLSRFVRYKAHFCRLGRVADGFDPSSVLAGFEEWMAECSNAGERDARSLPLHVFCPTREWDGLDRDEQIAEFECCYGRPASRTDGQRIWTPGLHGRESIVVAGAPLRAGFHWDVASGRGSGRVCTSAEVWRFTPDAYCNVYPDATVRQGQRRGKSAKQVYVAKRPDETLRGDRSHGAGRRRRR